MQQIEEDIAKAQAALKTKKENLEKEKSELAKLRAAFSPPQNQAASAAQIAELEKQELESLREWHREQQAASSADQEEARVRMAGKMDELATKRRKIESEAAAEAVAAEAARQPVP